MSKRLVGTLFLNEEVIRNGFVEITRDVHENLLKLHLTKAKSTDHRKKLKCVVSVYIGKFIEDLSEAICI